MLDEGVYTDGALVPAFDPDWQPIFHVSNQVVLYHPTSHALSIRQSSQYPKVGRPPAHCPYCNSPLPSDFDPHADGSNHGESFDTGLPFYSRASNYFQLLAIANETSSRPSTPPSPPVEERRGRRSSFAADAMAEGYFKAFFQEECRLGMGANGTVFLCQHVLDGNPLGHFAIKKIAVGESHSYLLRILREVRLLERLHHPNIITYHHAWLETCQFSSFGPKVPTLHLLMQWAEGGSLDEFIDARLGRSTRNIHLHQGSAAATPRLSGISTPDTPNIPTLASGITDLHSRSARIRAFRAFQKAPPGERERLRGEKDEATGSLGGYRQTWTAVHLLSANEVKGLLGDVTEGLSFLHGKSILHLDLKPGNVLLTWDEGKLIPRAMLSDFGTSRDMLHSSRPRSGNTGTLEYTAPESLPSPQTGLVQQVDSKADMWSLGMILHKLLFFRLPYRYASDGDADTNRGNASAVDEADTMDRLEKEVLRYTGFRSTPALVTAFEARRLSRAFLVLLESLLDVTPSRRPSCERVASAIHEGRLDPLPEGFHKASSLMPVMRRPSNGENNMMTSTEPTQGVQSSEKKDGNNISSGGTVGPSDSEQVHSSKEETPGAKDQNGDRVPLLGLPAPQNDLTVWERAVGIINDILERRTEVPRVRWRMFCIDMAKSIILVTKVLTLAYLCPDAYPGPVIVMFFVSITVIDTRFDRLWISVTLCVLHIVVMRLGCLGGRCCV